MSRRPIFRWAAPQVYSTLSKCSAAWRVSPSRSSRRAMWCAILWCKGLYRLMKKKRPSQTIKPETAPLELTVQYAFRKAGAARRPWAPTRHMIALWAYAALGPRRTPCDLAVRVVGAPESRRLNKQFRGKDKPTNVLSFPATVAQADGRRPLGDLIVCAPVVAEEAAQQAKSREAHWAHMVV